MIGSGSSSKYYSLLLFLLLAAGSCMGQINIGQLRIASGTSWVSDTGTTVVLDNMDLHYDAAPVLLNNIFRFTGMRINSIRGENHPLIYAIGVAKDNPGELVLDQDINVTKRISFEKGLFDMNGHGIFLQPDALLINENEYSRIIGPAGGFITIDAELHTPAAVNPGNLGAIITSAGNLGRINIFRSHDPQSINDSSKSIARWFGISVPDNITNIDASLRFNYFDGESEGFQNDSLVLWQTANDGHWADQGYTTRDASQKYVEKQGLTRLKNFTLAPAPAGSSTTSPPAQGATLLTGSWNNDAAFLKWFVTSEYQNDHFDVERKYTTQSDFAPIGSVPTNAPGGTQTFPSVYSYTDLTVKTSPDDISYRIRQVSANGAATYSNIITLKAKNGSPQFILRLYPTIAVGGRIYIEVGNMPLAKMSFVIADARGRIVLAGDLPYQSQWLPVHFLSHGVYRLILRSGDQHWHSTFIR
jgi:hypothetical protein